MDNLAQVGVEVKYRRAKLSIEPPPDLNIVTTGLKRLGSFQGMGKYPPKSIYRALQKRCARVVHVWLQRTGANERTQCARLAQVGSSTAGSGRQIADCRLPAQPSNCDAPTPQPSPPRARLRQPIKAETSGCVDSGATLPQTTAGSSVPAAMSKSPEGYTVRSRASRSITGTSSLLMIPFVSGAAKTRK